MAKILDSVLDLKKWIRDIPNFPKPGIIFKDISPLLEKPEVFSFTVDQIIQPYLRTGITKVCGIEARGFIFGAAAAVKLNAGFIPIRKAGKLPHATHKHTYDLEYGTDSIEIHSDAINSTDKVLLIDDVLATGGTLKAAVNLIQISEGKIAGITTVLELVALNGRSKVHPYSIHTLIQYS